MHQTLDASIDALVGRLPAVAPVATQEEEPEGTETHAPPGDKLEAARQALKEAIDKLQEVLESLK
jgi:hypothetical protein